MSTDAGRTYLGDAVEIRYRLPKIWKAVTSGRLVVWKARKIAQATKTLCPEGAAYVDRHLAHHAHRCSFAQIDRAVDDALRLFDPEQAEKKRREAADERCFDVDLDQVSFNGTVHVDGELDIADALDLNDAITAGAKKLAELGCEESLTCAAQWPLVPSPAVSWPWTSRSPNAHASCDLRPPRRRRRRRCRRCREHQVRGLSRAGQGLVPRHQHQGHRSDRSSTSTPT